MTTKRVLITGFGPFENADNNLSWDGVNYLNKDKIEAKYDIKLFTEKIEVVYKNVDGSVPKLWRKHDPHLTIHVGVRDVSEFLLEKQACKLGYQAEDTTGDCPGMHWCDGPHVLSTSLDVDLVCEEFNSAPPADDLQAKPSCDAGKYVCEYTYYASLYESSPCARTLFVHIPYKGLQVEKIAQGLERILEICLKQLRDE
ncbi:pyroglutamyl-peptidase 1-like [Helicoverpa zea]|uniref:pyroglutamyl-peptidase 1-like n=1 Tax=Helicoverpa zea TaxID=7113 RepID=UPI001F57FCA1|nr:pyroglutamyl-peptidase 1-like [Helicoverpa zea]